MYELDDLLAAVGAYLAIFIPLCLVIAWILIRLRWPRVRWVKGNLYVRICKYSITLFYLNTKKKKGSTRIHISTLAKHEREPHPSMKWATNQLLGSRTEDVSDFQKVIQRGNIIIFRKARRKDLLILLQNWDPSYISLKAWVELISAC